MGDCDRNPLFSHWVRDLEDFQRPLTAGDIAAQKAYPLKHYASDYERNEIRTKRTIFLQGYNDAKEAFTWEDVNLLLLISDELMKETGKEFPNKEHYEEVLKRYKEIINKNE